MIGRYLTLEELTRSDYAARKGIDNSPPDNLIISNLNQWAINVYDPIRDHFGIYIPVTSGYRSPKLNKAIGGSTSSQHCKGEAGDLSMKGTGQALTNQALFMYILQNIEFDQLINEFNFQWVHVSYRKGNNRKEVLQAVKEGGKAIYKPFEP